MDSCRAWHEAAIQSLALLHKGARGVVSSIDAGTSAAGVAAAATIGDVAGSTIVRRLMELGFVPGEPLEVVEEVRPGGDPIAVRIGRSVFALRRREAQSVMVKLEQPQPSQLR